MAKQAREISILPGIFAVCASLCFLQSNPVFADSDEERAEEEASLLSLTEFSAGEDLDELPGVSAELTTLRYLPADSYSPSARAEEYSESASICLDDYAERKRQLLRRSILNPVLTFPAMVAGASSGMLGGAYVGVMTTESAAWGSIAGSGWGLLIGFWGTGAVFAAREAILVAKYVDTVRMQNLLREARAGEGPMLRKLRQKVSRFGGKVSVSTLAARVRNLDAKGYLCDGSLTGFPSARRPLLIFGKKRIPLRKRLVSMRSLAKLIASSSASP